MDFRANALVLLGGGAQEIPLRGHTHINTHLSLSLVVILGLRTSYAARLYLFDVRRSCVYDVCPMVAIGLLPGGIYRRFFGQI